MKKLLIGFTILSSFVFSTQAKDFSQEIEKDRNIIQTIIQNPVIMNSIKDANKITINQQEIQEKEKIWAEERKQNKFNFIKTKLNNQSSDYLRSQLSSYKGLMLELVVTDKNGLNVAQTLPSQDYWQGDEAKFTDVFPKGCDGKWISKPEKDEDLGIVSIQISGTICENNVPIGTYIASLDTDKM